MVNYVILLIIANAFWITGIHKLFYFEQMDGDVDPYSKNLLWYPGYKVYKAVGHFWSKPLFLCPPCMSSVHTLYIYFPALYITGNLTSLTALSWVVYAVIVCGVVSFINRD